MKEEKVTTACNFLKHVYQDQILMIGTILTAEADKDYDTIVQILEIVKGYIDNLIKEIKLK